MCICMYMFTHTHTHTYMHAYIHTHTYVLAYMNCQKKQITQVVSRLSHTECLQLQMQNVMNYK